MSSFRCRQFTLEQGNCAMRISTDAMLLGAWASFPQQTSDLIVDVGTGTGILALMLAQRYAWARVLGVELEPEAAVTAAANFAQSPWSNRLSLEAVNVLDWLEERPKFAHLISNPPYYSAEKHYQMGVSNRRLARQQGDLGPETLLRAFKLLPHGGSLQLVLPVWEAEDYRLSFKPYACLYRQCFLAGHQAKAPKRVLLHFVRNLDLQPLEAETLSIYDLSLPSPHNYTAACRAMLRDFLTVL